MDQVIYALTALPMVLLALGSWWTSRAEVGPDRDERFAAAAGSVIGATLAGVVAVVAMAV